MLANSARAESDDPPVLLKEMGVMGLGAFPQGGGDAPLGGPAYGLELGGGVGLLDWPLSVGADLRALDWNESSKRLTLQIDELSLPAELTRSDVTATFSGYVRLQPRVWRFRPFLETGVGLRGLSVKYTLRVEGASAPITTGKQALQPTWSVGGGIDFLLGQTTSTSGSDVDIYARIGLRRNFAGPVDINPETEAGRAQLKLGVDTIVLSAGITMTFCDACWASE